MANMPTDATVGIRVDVDTTPAEAAIDRVATCLEEAAAALRQGVGVTLKEQS